MRPTIFETAAKGTGIPVSTASYPADAAVNQPTAGQAFWPKYKWYVVGGVAVIILGVSWLIYDHDVKKKKTMQKN